MIIKSDYVRLLQFKMAIRKFLRITEDEARLKGLTPQQHQVLLAIKGQEAKDWASISEIAEALQLKHHTTVGLIDRCQAAGLVARRPNMQDRRQVQVWLSENGEKILSDLSSKNLLELEALGSLMKTPQRSRESA